MLIEWKRLSISPLFKEKTMNSDIINNFKNAMKFLNEKDLEIVSNNLHKNNVRIDRDIRFSLLSNETRSKRSYTSIRVGWG